MAMHELDHLFATAAHGAARVLAATNATAGHVVDGPPLPRRSQPLSDNPSKSVPCALDCAAGTLRCARRTTTARTRPHSTLATANQLLTGRQAPCLCTMECLALYRGAVGGSSCHHPDADRPKRRARAGQRLHLCLPLPRDVACSDDWQCKVRSLLQFRCTLQHCAQPPRRAFGSKSLHA